MWHWVRRHSLIGMVVGLALVGLPGQHAAASDLVQQMRDGAGIVLYLRHATAPGGGDPEGFSLGDCATQRNLSAAGRREARQLGRQLRRLDIPIAAVRSSPWCRARQTAELLNLGPVRTADALGSLFTVPDARRHPYTDRTRAMIRAHRQRPGVLVLVGHQVNISAISGVAPASGEGVVLRANRDGAVEVLGRLSSDGRFTQP